MNRLLLRVQVAVIFGERPHNNHHRRVENFVLCPAHYDAWSQEKKARALRELAESLTELREISDHVDLNIFL